MLVCGLLRSLMFWVRGRGFVGVVEFLVGYMDVDF